MLLEDKMESLGKPLAAPQNRQESNTIELYLVVLYAIDWLFRQEACLMQGIWDELLFITIVGPWI